MYDGFTNPKDAVRPIAAALEAAQYISLDPHWKSLSDDLVQWAHETAIYAAQAQEKADEEQCKK